MNSWHSDGHGINWPGFYSHFHIWSNAVSCKILRLCEPYADCIARKMGKVCISSYIIAMVLVIYNETLCDDQYIKNREQEKSNWDWYLFMNTTILLCIYTFSDHHYIIIPEQYIVIMSLCVSFMSLFCHYNNQWDSTVKVTDIFVSYAGY